MVHDEERRAFERLGKRAGQKAQVAKFGEPSGFVVSGTGRECCGYCRVTVGVSCQVAVDKSCDLSAELSRPGLKVVSSAKRYD